MAVRRKTQCAAGWRLIVSTSLAGIFALVTTVSVAAGEWATAVDSSAARAETTPSVEPHRRSIQTLPIAGLSERTVGAPRADRGTEPITVNQVDLVEVPPTSDASSSEIWQQIETEWRELDYRSATITLKMIQRVGLQKRPSVEPADEPTLPAIDVVAVPVPETEVKPLASLSQTTTFQSTVSQSTGAAVPLIRPTELSRSVEDLLGASADSAPLGNEEEKTVTVESPVTAEPAVFTVSLPVERTFATGDPRAIAARARAKVSKVKQTRFQEPLDDTNTYFEVLGETGEIEVMVRRGKVLRTRMNLYRTAVVDPMVCDVIQFTPREVQIVGKAVGATHVTFWFEGGLRRPVTYLVRIVPDQEVVKNVEYRYGLLEDMLAELFPNSKVRLSVLANKLIVRGQANDAEEATRIMQIVGDEANALNVRYGSPTQLTEGRAAEVFDERTTGRPNRQYGGLEIVNLLRVPGVHQVALRVKIAEVNRSAGRGLNSDLSAKLDFGGENGSGIFLQSIAGLMAGQSSSLLAQFDGDDIQIGLNYLEEHGVLRLLSEPTVVTLSGRPATFVAGGEFAVPTAVGAAGLNAVTTDYRAFGTIVSFVPTVLDKDHIRLQVAPEFSSINGGLSVNGSPGLNVKSVSTTVEMREGQTFAIAGLLDDNMASSKSSTVPFLSNLFNHRSVTRTETELIILVTPELIHPMEPEETPPLPGFDVTEPNNYQFYIRSHIEGDPAFEHRSTIWPRLKRRYGRGGPSMISGPYGHGQ